MTEQQEQQNTQLPGETVLLHPDHHIVATASFSYIVSPVMARHIEQELDRRRRPKWITFVDVSGARIRIPQKPRITLGIAASISTSGPTMPRTPAGASRLR